jgi:uncharacterized protein YjiS (DUF1127 family)
MHTRLMEVNMSRIFGDATDLRGLADVNAVWIVHVIRQCWQAFVKWRAEQAALSRTAAELLSMSERELKDIGLVRSEIGSVVKGELARINDVLS